MFTGIVQEIGTVRTVEYAGDLLRLRVEAARTLERVREGDSIAVDGVCLTVLRHDGRAFEAQAIPTTLARTTLGELVPGTRVNLERAVAAGEPLGGHIVQGHVDGVGTVRAVERAADSVLVDVAVPVEVSRVTVPRGSIALAGVSLTVADLPAADVVRVSLIPYTLGHTTLASVQAGSRLNVEADFVAKLVAEQARRWLESRGIEVAGLNRA